MYLQADSGRGYGLDVSLFERLIKADFPYSALQTQHRMRPEISDIVRNLMYPALLDAPAVATHPPLRGTQQSAFLVTHDWPEGADDAAGLAQLDSQSKTNFQEAAMAIAALRYCLQQSYAGSRIAILTPYLGQLSVLRRLLQRQRFDFQVGEKDAQDLLEEVRHQISIDAD
jgi:superfamily I DNA and/or RNA helicase